MKKGIDVKHVNPFLQASMNVVESVAQMKLTVGKPMVHSFEFPNLTYTIQVGITGAMRGQVVLSMEDMQARLIASKMMGGMPVDTLDEMACSALNELSNMILGNTATVFSTQGILIDITPPMAVLGSNVKIKSDIDGLKIPLLYDGTECIGLHICVFEE